MHFKSLARSSLAFGHRQQILVTQMTVHSIPLSWWGRPFPEKAQFELNHILEEDQPQETPAAAEFTEIPLCTKYLVQYWGHRNESWNLLSKDPSPSPPKSSWIFAIHARRILKGKNSSRSSWSTNQSGHRQKDFQTQLIYFFLQYWGLNSGVLYQWATPP